MYKIFKHDQNHHVKDFRSIISDANWHDLRSREILEIVILASDEIEVNCPFKPGKQGTTMFP